MVVDKPIPLENNRNKLYAINGTKGCYLGQAINPLA
jgi:folate-binding Fe-S cluster repair protein YgfZ